jgi:hypothetical protein
MRNIVPFDQLHQYAVNASKGMEAIYEPRYDYLTYPAAGSTQLTFFQTPVGSGGTTEANTNMDAAGQLTNPSTFLLTAISIDFIPGVNPGTSGTTTQAPLFLQDVWAVGSGLAYLKLQIGNKPQLVQGPLYKFASPFGLDVSGAAATTVTTDAVTINYAKFGGHVFQVTPMLIPTNQAFNVKLIFPTAIATPSTTAGRIGVNMHGTLYRSIQ